MKNRQTKIETPTSRQIYFDKRLKCKWIGYLTMASNSGSSDTGLSDFRQRAPWLQLPSSPPFSWLYFLGGSCRCRGFGCWWQLSFHRYNCKLWSRGWNLVKGLDFHPHSCSGFDGSCARWWQWQKAWGRERRFGVGGGARKGKKRRKQRQPPLFFLLLPRRLKLSFGPFLSFSFLSEALLLQP